MCGGGGAASSNAGGGGIGTSTGGIGPSGIGAGPGGFDGVGMPGSMADTLARKAAMEAAVGQSLSLQGANPYEVSVYGLAPGAAAQPGWDPTALEGGNPYTGAPAPPADPGYRTSRITSGPGVPGYRTPVYTNPITGVRTLGPVEQVPMSSMGRVGNAIMGLAKLGLGAALTPVATPIGIGLMTGGAKNVGQAATGRQFSSPMDALSFGIAPGISVGPQDALALAGLDLGAISGLNAMNNIASLGMGLGYDPAQETGMSTTGKTGKGKGTTSGGATAVASNEYDMPGGLMGLPAGSVYSQAPIAVAQAPVSTPGVPDMSYGSWRSTFGPRQAYTQFG